MNHSDWFYQPTISLNCCFELFQSWRGREGRSNADRGSWVQRETWRTKWSLYKWKQMPGIMNCRSADGERRWWSASRPHSWSLTSDALVCSAVMHVPTQSRLSERVKPALRHMISDPFPPFLAKLYILHPSITFDWSGCAVAVIDGGCCTAQACQHSSESEQRKACQCHWSSYKWNVPFAAAFYC